MKFLAKDVAPFLPAEPDTRRRFPAGFVWGAGTAAYQIEGAAAEDGRAPSIWDSFCRRPGAVHAADNGDVAADHYHRYIEDARLLATLGLDAYRFSVSWSRVQPDGCGAVNPAGLDFYARLVDELLKRGIRPTLTLYHWDLPQALQDKGGWGNRDTAYRFAEYAALMAQTLGDRVPVWSTLNEPWCSAFLGHAAGTHAPGATDGALALRTAHHLLLAHGLGARAVRSAAPRPVRLSISLNLSPVTVRGDTDEDYECLRRVDGLLNRLFLDPVLRGSYPADVVNDAAQLTDWAFVRAGDERLIAAHIDLLGVNYYTTTRVVTGAPQQPTSFPTAPEAHLEKPAGPTTAMGWAIDADGLFRLLIRLHLEYPGMPMVITENGAAFEEDIGDDGSIRDRRRVAYLRAHLLAAHRAVCAGVPLQGYFVWSLLDNFEWAMGYSKRFGLVHVDFATQQRRLKESAHWYRDVAATNTVG